MKRLSRVSLGSLALAVLLLGAWGPGEAADGPILEQRAETELELDLGMIVDDFAPALIEMAAVEDESAPEKIRALMALLGLEALDRLHVKSSLDDERGLTRMTVTLDASADGGLLGDLLSIPSGRFAFGRYVHVDEVSLVLCTNGLRERIGAIENLFARPELRQLVPIAPTDPLSLASMWDVDLREDILPHLSGELDVVLFPCREDQACEIPNVALVLGLTDGPAFREVVLDILARLMGEEQGAALRETQGESAGDFTFYPASPQLAYAIAPDMGILTTDPEGLKTLVGRRDRGDLAALDATVYVRADGDRILEMLSGLIAKGGADDPEVAIVAEMLEAVGEEPIGTIEYTARTGKGRLETELRVPATLYSAEYRFIKELLTAAPRLQALQPEDCDLQEVVQEIDEALTRYGRDHDGTFPASLEELVEAGYLDTLPDLVPTGLGEYVEGGFTYLPLRDDAGAVVGHYFFVYGCGENTGHDVFTEENLADPGRFRVGRDGKNDGVAGFSYDGIALEHVEAWGK
jgi:hypothetical protein